MKKYLNKVEITFGDDKKYKANFNNYFENDYYLVADKELIAQELGRKIIDNFGNTIYRDNEEFDNGEILQLIDEEFLDDIRCNIYDLVEEYLINNL